MTWHRARSGLVVAGLASGLVLSLLPASCAESKPEELLPAIDRQGPPKETFDPNSIISRDELTDTSLGAEALIAFLTYRSGNERQRKSPYGHDSVLATYHSNGVSAVDALVNAAEQHGINPLVLLVRAEMAQAVVAMGVYPADVPERVEFVFRCGCTGPETCDVNLAGFDRQVDCLARQYRVILDDMEKSPDGATSGGWQKGVARPTIDRQSVAPVDEGTAAAYQFEPVVGDERSGNRLFWNIWKLYVVAAGYQSPAATGVTGRWIGDECSDNDSQCRAIPGGKCVQRMCTAPCHSVPCPQRDGAPRAWCAPAGELALCYTECTTNTETSCHDRSAASSCCNVAVTEGAGTQSLCIPTDGCTSVTSN